MRCWLLTRRAQVNCCVKQLKMKGLPYYGKPVLGMVCTQPKRGTCSWSVPLAHYREQGEREEGAPGGAAILFRPCTSVSSGNGVPSVAGSEHRERTSIFLPVAYIMGIRFHIRRQRRLAFNVANSLVSESTFQRESVLSGEEVCTLGKLLLESHVPPVKQRRFTMLETRITRERNYSDCERPMDVEGGSIALPSLYHPPMSL